jgi:hypothetical protein
MSIFDDVGGFFSGVGSDISHLFHPGRAHFLHDDEIPGDAPPEEPHAVPTPEDGSRPPAG